MDWIQWWAVGLAFLILVNLMFVAIKDPDPRRGVVFGAGVVTLAVGVVAYLPVLGRVWGWW